MELEPPLEDVAARFAAACDACGIDYALIGGLAAIAHGADLTTQDVDACVALSPTDDEGIERLLSALREREFRINVDALRKRAKRGSTILFLAIGKIRMDVMLRKADGYWEEALAHRRRIPVEGNQLWVASPEDIFLLKLAAGRPKDVEGCGRLLKVQYRNLDLPRLRASAARLAAKVPELPARIEALLAEADELNRLADELPEDEA